MSFEAILKTITNKLNPFTTEKLGILLNKIKNKDSESELNLENIIDDLLYNEREINDDNKNENNYTNNISSTNFPDIYINNNFSSNSNGYNSFNQSDKNELINDSEETYDKIVNRIYELIMKYDDENKTKQILNEIINLTKNNLNE
jgi:hypothetical protein